MDYTRSTTIENDFTASGGWLLTPLVLLCYCHESELARTMHLSAKTEYACIAVLELAIRFGTGKPVRIREIADPNGIPSRFLVQILLQLKSAGIVGSTRGAAGGYQLMKEPGQITLAEVMAASEGQISDPVSSAGQQTPTTRSLFSAWNELAAAERNLLESINFAQLADRATNQIDNMYYI